MFDKKNTQQTPVKVRPWYESYHPMFSEAEKDNTPCIARNYYANSSLGTACLVYDLITCCGKCDCPGGATAEACLQNSWFDTY